MQSSAAVPFTDTHYNATPWKGVGCIDPCDDYLDGPRCTAGRVISLVLRNHSLYGAMTSWTNVGQLRNLTVLDLSYNQLSGTLPTELGRIQNMEMLQLRDNSLSGLLPSQLGKLNTGQIGAPGVMEEIVLANNFIEGHLPPSLNAAIADNLMMLDVSNNRLSGTIPSAYASLPMLQVLYLRHNSFSGSLPSMFGESVDGNGGLNQLRYLEMHTNPQLSGTLPEAMGGLVHMQSISGYGNKLSGSVPSTLGLLTQMTHLQLHDNALSGSIPTQLGLLNELEYFDLHNNPLDGTFPSQLGRLINLKSLYLPNEQLDPLRKRYCQQRLPNVGKYNYRIVREEYYRMASSLCPEPFDTLNAFGTLAQISGDV